MTRYIVHTHEAWLAGRGVTARPVAMITREGSEEIEAMAYGLTMAAARERAEKLAAYMTAEGI